MWTCWSKTSRSLWGILQTQLNLWDKAYLKEFLIQINSWSLFSYCYVPMTTWKLWDYVVNKIRNKQWNLKIFVMVFTEKHFIQGNANFKWHMKLPPLPTPVRSGDEGRRWKDYFWLTSTICRCLFVCKLWHWRNVVVNVVRDISGQLEDLHNFSRQAWASRLS